jgi:hypothetical protein
MKLSIRKDVGHRYLVIADEKTNESNYKEKMILNNKIEGFASCFLERVDDEELFYYEIPFGYSQLSVLLDTQQTDENIYKAVFLAIANAIENAREYLLDTDGIVLNTEGIFISAETNEICLAYYPYAATSFEENCVRLSEELLHNMNSSNKAAVDIGYKFYRNCVQNKICGDLLKEMASEVCMPLKTEKEEYVKQIDLKKIAQEEENRETVRKDDYSFLFDEDDNEDEVKKEKKGKSARKNRLKNLFGRRKEKNNYVKETRAEMNMNEHRNLINMNYDAGNLETQVLKQDSQYKRKAVIIQNYGKRDEIRTNLFKENYLIGQGIAGADIELKSAGISRIHARLSWKDGRYSITDLGSRNGSIVNGDELKPGEKFELESGDDIQLADIILKIVY